MKRLVVTTRGGLLPFGFAGTSKGGQAHLDSCSVFVGFLGGVNETSTTHAMFLN